MLTYELNKAPGVPLYEALYRCIREDILRGVLTPGQKLPSKRSLATHLEISKITVEAAYAQLAMEGYITAREKIGYFVEAVERPAPVCTPVFPAENTPADTMLDLTRNTPAKFPFSVWSKLQREALLEFGHQLLEPIDPKGLPILRQVIARHLFQFRGMQVDQKNVIIGAGTDFLYNLLLQLLGPDRTYALEDPGYSKIRRIYEAAGVRTVSAEMDSFGVMPEALESADVLHISPSHHFPTGIITPMHRRQALLSWACQADRWIIEDDYDSEFRFNAHPMSAMYSPENSGRVIYINSFSKSLAPSIRIGYMVLPPALMERFRQKLDFYSCTVSAFEQHTLAKFLSEGHFEKHINRMRKFYRTRRNRLLDILKNCPQAHQMTILEENAGLHFLLRIDTQIPDDELERYCGQLGLRLRTLSSYYRGPVPAQMRHCLVINYSGLQDGDLDRLRQILET